MTRSQRPPDSQRPANGSGRAADADRDLEIKVVQAEKLASLGLLAAGVAHEINNPASFVLANIEALARLLGTIETRLESAPASARDPGLKPLLFEATTILQESKEGMARIHQMVRDLRSFTRPDGDKDGTCDVNAAIESSLMMTRNELRYHAQVERDLRATSMVRGGSARLGQVFINLILNASHAMGQSDPTRNRLRVRSFDDGAQVEVVFEDNGPGIGPDVIGRIFDAFFTTKPNDLGTGLGLPISRDIVRSVGGDIIAESTPGQGARFRVRIPAAQGSAPEATTAEREAIVARGRHLTPRRHRVLAVDDEALLLKAYRRMLIDHYDVEVRRSGREAISLLERDRAFDLVLCDLQMPDVSGMDLFHTVRERWPELAGRFILISGGEPSDETRGFIADGQVACLAKPFQMKDLLDLLEQRILAAPGVTE